MIGPVRIGFTPLANEVMLSLVMHGSAVWAEMPLADAKKLLRQLEKTIAMAAEWEPAESLADMLGEPP